MSWEVENEASTLETYLKRDRSIQSVSEKSYIHRSTVNYRIKKIKKLWIMTLVMQRRIFYCYLAYMVERL